MSFSSKGTAEVVSSSSFSTLSADATFLLMEILLCHRNPTQLCSRIYVYLPVQVVFRELCFQDECSATFNKGIHNQYCSCLFFSSDKVLVTIWLFS
jgi:hypothetical protein